MQMNLVRNEYILTSSFITFAGLFFYFRQFSGSILELYTTQNDIHFDNGVTYILGRFAMLYINMMLPRHLGSDS